MKYRVNVLNPNILIVLCACNILSCENIFYHENIYGVWEGEFQGKEVLFKFEPKQTCVLSYKDIATGSVETIKGNFEIDFSKFPIPLSVRNIPELKHSLYTIVEFVDIDSIKIANFSPRWRFRPISFNRNTSIHLKRFNKKI